MPLNYRKNNVNLTSEYYNDINDLNGPGVCQDHRLNLMFENQRRYIGLVDNDHEQASDLTVTIGDKDLRLAKKSKYSQGQIDYTYNFKGIGIPDSYDFLEDGFVEGKNKYDEKDFVILVNNQKVNKIYNSNCYFSLINYKDENNNDHAAYWNYKINASYTDFPISITSYSSQDNDGSELHLAISQDNKLYAWKNSTYTCYYDNIDYGDILNIKNEKINSFDQLTNLFEECNILFSKVDGDSTGILMTDTNGKLYGWGEKIRETKSGIGADFSSQSEDLISIMPNLSFKSFCAKNSIYWGKCAYYAIDSDDRLWAWGRNGNAVYTDIPTIYGKNLEFDSVIILNERGVALSKDKQKIYTWGKSPVFGTANNFSFSDSPEYKAEKDIGFSCIGEFNRGTAYIIDNNNKVFLWGLDENSEYSLTGLELSESDLIAGVFERNYDHSQYAFIGLTPILKNFNIKKISFPYFLTTDNKLYKIRKFNPHYYLTDSELPPYLVKENVIDFYKNDSNLFIIDDQNNLLGSGNNYNEQLLRKTYVYPFKNINKLNNLNLDKTIFFGDLAISKSKDGYLLINLKPLSYYTSLNLINDKDIKLVESLYTFGFFEFKNKKIKDFFINMFISDKKQVISMIVLDEYDKYILIFPKKVYISAQQFKIAYESGFNLFNDNIKKVEILENGEKIKKTAGKFALMNSGELFEFFPSFDLESEIIDINLKKIDYLETQNIVFQDINGSAMSLGPILALSNDKKIYSFEFNNSDGDYWGGEGGDIGGSESDIKINCIKHEYDFNHISQGTMFSTAIDKDNKLYTWGRNWNGQLGFFADNPPEHLNAQEPIYEIKEPINIMPECKFVCSFANEMSGMAIDCNGDLYAWGSGIFKNNSKIETIEIKKLDIKLNLNNKFNFYDMRPAFTILSEEIKNSTLGAWI